jgi:hypothetical protein
LLEGEYGMLIRIGTANVQQELQKTNEC